MNNSITPQWPPLYRAPMPTVVLSVGDFITGAFQPPPGENDMVEVVPTGWCFLFAGSMHTASGPVPWNAFVFEKTPSPYGAPPVIATSTVRMVIEAITERTECDPGNVNVSCITPMLWDGPPWPLSPEHGQTSPPAPDSRPDYDLIAGTPES